MKNRIKPVNLFRQFKVLSKHQGAYNIIISFSW